MQCQFSSQCSHCIFRKWRFLVYPYSVWLDLMCPWCRLVEVCKGRVEDEHMSSRGFMFCTFGLFGCAESFKMTNNGGGKVLEASTCTFNTWTTRSYIYWTQGSDKKVNMHKQLIGTIGCPIWTVFIERSEATFWALSLECMCRHESECTEGPLSKADRSHLVASRTPFFHKCPATVLSLFRDPDTTHTQIIARPFILFLSARVTREVNFLF